MKKNMGMADKFIRLVIGLTIAVLYYSNVINGNTGILLLVLAVLLILTSFINFCPLYEPFGIKTCRGNSREK
jgi:hypothetical protein